jgi:putative transposase
VIPFLALPAGVRRVVYTTNTIEALHRQIRKTIKREDTSPPRRPPAKLIYLSIINAQKSRRTTYNRSAALLSFKIHFGDRLLASRREPPGA